jgi:hypothetical protein
MQELAEIMHVRLPRIGMPLQAMVNMKTMKFNATLLGY